MKSTGIVRKVDELGRIVIPKELRRTLNIEEGTPIEIFVDGNQIILQKYEPNAEKDDVVGKLEALVPKIKSESARETIERAIKLIK